MTRKSSAADVWVRCSATCFPDWVATYQAIISNSSDECYSHLPQTHESPSSILARLWKQDPLALIAAVSDSGPQLGPVRPAIGFEIFRLKLSTKSRSSSTSRHQRYFIFVTDTWRTLQRRMNILKPHYMMLSHDSTVNCWVWNFA